MAWAEGEEAMAAMAPEGGLFARLDPVSLGSSLLAVGRRTWQNPVETANAWWRRGLSLASCLPGSPLTNYFLSNPIADAPGTYIHG